MISLSVWNLLEQITQGGRWWLFLDYDGTLADFAPTPAEVQPDPELMNLLDRLAHFPERLRLVVLSGRKISQVEQLVPPGIFVAGTYGIEFCDPQGMTSRQLDLPDLRRVLDPLKERWAGLIQGKKGFYLEDKDWALALHAKLASHEQASSVLSWAHEMAEAASLANQFRILQGPRFLEVAPRTANKGQTVDLLLERYPWPGAQIVYFGDDDRDEEAFRVVRAREGICVLVARQGHATAAQITVEAPAVVRKWLSRLAEGMANGAQKENRPDA